MFEVIEKKVFLSKGSWLSFPPRVAMPRSVVAIPNKNHLYSYRIDYYLTLLYLYDSYSQYQVTRYVLTYLSGQGGGP